MLASMRILGVVVLSLLLLGACAKPETSQTQASAGPPKSAAPPVVQQLAGAATTPLHDLNLLHAKIPAVLLEALKAPYAPPADPTCTGLAAEIRMLDTALGEDLDGPKKPDPSLVDRGRAQIDEAAIGAVKSNAEALIPFRAWVRKLTGAERASQQVTRAIAAGIVRRAYLKGLGQARGCEAPAAPRPVVPPTIK